MNIGIDATPLAIPFYCGLKNYAINLLSNLSNIDTKNSYYIFVPRGVRIPLAKNFYFVDIPKFPIFKRQILLPYLAGKYDLDVFHFLEPYGSILLKHPNIVTTVPDLDLEQTYPLMGKYVLKRIFCEVARYFVFRNTKYFISISGVVRKELKKYLALKFHKPIKTVYMGIGRSHIVSRKETDSKKYYLAMGDFAPRKNVVRTIRAYSLLPKEVKNEYSLKIIASTSSSAKKFRFSATESNVNSSVKILVNVSKEKLVAYYNKALAFIYPSLYEGFGYPIIEAMACGCPVITSNYGAMKEIAGDAALFVDPRSIVSVERAMLRMIKDNKLKRRLISNGIKRASQFPWEKTAKETLKIYETI